MGRGGKQSIKTWTQLQKKSKNHWNDNRNTLCLIMLFILRGQCTDPFMNTPYIMLFYIHRFMQWCVRQLFKNHSKQHYTQFQRTGNYVHGMAMCLLIRWYAYPTYLHYSIILYNWYAYPIPFLLTILQYIQPIHFFPILFTDIGIDAGLHLYIYFT